MARTALTTEQLTEIACGAVCSFCHAGYPPDRQVETPWWFHTPANEEPTPCMASTVRAALAAALASSSGGEGGGDG